MSKGWIDAAVSVWLDGRFAEADTVEIMPGPTSEFKKVASVFATIEFFKGVLAELGVDNLSPYDFTCKELRIVDREGQLVCLSNVSAQSVSRQGSMVGDRVVVRFVTDSPVHVGEKICEACGGVLFESDEPYHWACHDAPKGCGAMFDIEAMARPDRLVDLHRAQDMAAKRKRDERRRPLNAGRASYVVGPETVHQGQMVSINSEGRVVPATSEGAAIGVVERGATHQQPWGCTVRLYGR